MAVPRPRKVLRELSSFKLALAELAAIAGFSALGTVVEQGEDAEFYLAQYGEAPLFGVLDGRALTLLGADHVYTSAPFLALLGLLAASLAACRWAEGAIEIGAHSASLAAMGPRVLTPSLARCRTIPFSFVRGFGGATRRAGPRAASFRQLGTAVTGDTEHRSGAYSQRRDPLGACTGLTRSAPSPLPLSLPSRSILLQRDKSVADGQGSAPLALPDAPR